MQAEGTLTVPYNVMTTGHDYGCARCKAREFIPSVQTQSYVPRAKWSPASCCLVLIHHGLVMPFNQASHAPERFACHSLPEL